MHNFGIPFVLKLRIDRIVRVQDVIRCWRNTEGPAHWQEGHLHHLNLRHIWHPDALASVKFVEPYLRSLLGFLGMADATFLAVGGTMALNHGHDRGELLAPYFQVIRMQTRSLEGAA